jgi:uncharacterized protein YjbJ (UPF0337 family)
VPRRDEAAQAQARRLIAKPESNRSTQKNRDTIEGQWTQVKGKVKQQWAKLTDDDLTRIEGRRDVLIGRIQERYGIAQDEAERQIKQFERSLH